MIASDNGIYVYSTGTSIWDRASDFSSTSTNQAGDFVFILEGVTNNSQGYVMTQADTIVLGTTEITWTQYSGTGQITPGDGLQKSGQELSVDLKSGGGLIIDGTELAIDLATNSGLENVNGLKVKIDDDSIENNNGTIQVNNIWPDQPDFAFLCI